MSWLRRKLFRAGVSTNERVIDELLTRSVTEIIPDTEGLKKKLMSGKRLRIKLGMDPTSPNLHLGRSIPLLKLLDFQKLGHQIVFIVGDSTGIIGDTSDKDAERPMLTKKVVEANMHNYFKQVGKILDLGLIEKRHNSEWLDKLGYAEIGEHANQFSVSDFIARDNIKRRLDAGKRVSLRELLYPLMQGYDSVAVKADVELGGSDQRFNILAGRPLQECYGQEPQFALLNPLINGLDGRKMSSSWGNTINLTDAPNDMYGKVMSAHDSVVIEYFTHCTRISMADINTLELDLRTGKVHPRDAKMRLAFEITRMYHGEDAAKTAELAFTSTFQKGALPSDMQTVRANERQLLADVLINAKVIASKNEFRRLVDAGGVTMHGGEKITNYTAPATEGVYKVGKRRFIKIMQ